ncbi:hypothetical protein D3C81_1232360 [compost metagenome]
MLERAFFTQGHVLGVDYRAHCLHFVEPVNAPALEPHYTGYIAVERLAQSAERVVLARHYPRRRALEDNQALDLRGNAWHELDGAGARTDHRHALTFQGIAVVPARRVEGAPGKAVQARQIGHRRLAQTALAEDQETTVQWPSVGLDLPAQATGIEGCAGDLGVEAGVLDQTVVLGTGPQVGENLRLPRVGA